ncbi:MAG: XTP/dITP diphosphatase, partial [Candidatus Omnitrophica bacterium]|nr:XTP/dITP diphosphatase [Candidatus Omnitrophota bacterium]
MQLLIATKNKKKLKEIKEILRDIDLEIISLKDFGKVPRIIENGHTFKQNAVKKALKLAHFTKKLTLGEDSGLCVYALGGKPGIYSSRFSGKNKSDAQNNKKLLAALEGLPINKRRAYYSCAVALADEDGLIGVVEGRCSGLIGFQLKGSHGFGYDPLFVIPKYKKTFAQLGEKIKHRMSHRYHALRKAKKILVKYIEHC